MLGRGVERERDAREGKEELGWRQTKDAGVGEKKGHCRHTTLAGR